MNAYVYSPLDLEKEEIRLVLLYPGRGEEAVRCELRHVSLRNSPPYEALSYTWGNPDDTRKIQLDGQELSVTANLEEALRSLRHGAGGKERHKVFWVDAICINQQDIQERSQQVPRMRRVFETAEGVIVWLGRETSESAMAMDFLNQNSEHLVNGKAEFKAEGSHTKEWSAFRDGLVFKPWWSRLWIVQEVAVARHIMVVCGSKCVPWNVLISAYILVSTYHGHILAQSQHNASFEMRNRTLARDISDLPFHLENLRESIRLASGQVIPVGHLLVVTP
jgi:hypothetical protein